MRTKPAATLGLLTLLLGIAAYAARPQDNGDGSAKSQPDRLIEFLQVGSVVDLSFSGDSYQVIVLSDEQTKDLLEGAERLAAELETLTAGSDANGPANAREQSQVENALQTIRSPWKVVGLGEDFVHLKTVAKLSLHDASWAVLPESSIRSIKGSD